MRRHVENGMVKENGNCKRCHDRFGNQDNCRSCGVGRHQNIASRNSMRTKKIGGKRGRNSGVVKNKSNRK
jgi:hypothetical protein